MTTFSGRDALSFGWDKMRGNLRLWSKLLLLSFVFWVLESAIHGGPPGPPGGAGFVASTILQLIGVGVGIVWIKAALLVQDEQTITAPELLPTPALYLTYLVSALCYGLLVAAGLVLLVIPGLYWAVKYGFFGFLIVDKQLSPRAAFKRSAQMTEGVRGPLFLFALLLLGINILGVLALGIGLFATVPTTVMAAAYVYRRLQQRDSAAIALSRDHERGDGALLT